jgi:hypothetical protein
VKPFASRLLAGGRTFSPYLAIELVMPGGSLLALLLWLFRMSSARASKSQAPRTDEFQPPSRFYTCGRHL